MLRGQVGAERSADVPLTFPRLADSPTRRLTRAFIYRIVVCLLARDAYHACVEKSDGQVVDTCGSLRAAYEGACRKSWVRHFELQREKEQQVYRRIQAAIGDSGKREGTSGGLQGAVAR